MATAVSVGRELRPFRSPNGKAQNLQNQRSYNEDDEDGLVLEQPLRDSQRTARNDRDSNSEIISYRQSRKRPLSLPPQGSLSLRQSQYRQEREPKSEPWPSHQRPNLQTEDSSISHSHRGRDRQREDFKQPPPLSHFPSRQYNSISSKSNSNNMCNTPFRRNAATNQNRNSSSFSNAQNSNRGQFGYKQGTNAPRQQHRWHERSGSDLRANRTGEDRGNDRSGEYNRNLQARREDENRGFNGKRPEGRGVWGDRRPEGVRDRNERRPAADSRQYNEIRPVQRRDWNERRPENDSDRNRSNQYHERQAPFPKPYDGHRDYGRQDWRDRNDQGSRFNGTNNNSYIPGGRLPQERISKDYPADLPRHREGYYRNELSQDDGFRLEKSNSWDESQSNNSYLKARHPLNEDPRPTRRDNRQFEANDQPYNDCQNIHPRPLSSASSPQSRVHNQSTPTHDYRRNYDDGNANFHRYLSRDECREHANSSQHGLINEYSNNRQFGNDRSQSVGSNSQSQRIQLQQYRSERGDRRYEYSFTEPRVFQEKQASSLVKPSVGCNAPQTNTAVMVERIEPKNVSESKPMNKTEFGVQPKAQLERLDEKRDRSISSSNTSNPTPVAKKPGPPSKYASGIPMRWLKPNVKAKKPVQKSSPKEQGNSEEKKQGKKVDAAIPRISKLGNIEKRSGLMLSPSHRSPSSNRLVTDSEGGSTLSNMKEIIGESIERSSSKPKVPRAIVTKLPANTKIETTDDDLLKSDNDSSVDELKSESKPPPVLRTSTTSACSSNDSANSSASDDSDTDDEEVMMWASKMFGVPFRSSDSSPSDSNGGEEDNSPMKKLRLKLKLRRRETQCDEVMKAIDCPNKKKKTKKAKRKRLTDKESDKDEVILPLKKRKGKPKKRKTIGSDSNTHEEMEEERMRKESAKPLTAEQIEAILGEDDFAESGGSNWVRRSVRQPSKALLSAKPLRILVEKLKHNDPDMVVLKMKKYINDPNAPSVVLDAALDALEENTNCQTLYIQNFNEGMRDKQVMQLLGILQNPKCKIWCLNIGENYNVKTRTWDKFTKGLKKTKITHMYASEHTITTEMKDDIRASIRNNRKKHDMHINPNNLHVIVQCTHCWWNPINAKVLRPYLKKEGFEYILSDKEVQGLRGSSSAAPSI